MVQYWACMIMLIDIIVFKSRQFYHGKKNYVSTSFRHLGDGQLKNIEVGYFHNDILFSLQRIKCMQFQSLSCS